MNREAMSIFGYYDSPEQTEPAYDPGFEIMCPICLQQLDSPVVTVSLLAAGDTKNYFYRMHKRCFGSASEEEIQQIEDTIVSDKAVKQ